MISPCTLVCSIDRQTGFCAGCGRTGEEIAAWTSYTDAERRSLMEILPARLQAVEPETRLKAHARRAEKPLVTGGRRHS